MKLQLEKLDIQSCQVGDLVFLSKHSGYPGLISGFYLIVSKKERPGQSEPEILFRIEFNKGYHRIHREFTGLSETCEFDKLGIFKKVQIS